MQFEACFYAWGQKFCDGSRRKESGVFFILSDKAFLSKATSKEGKEGGIELIQPPAGSKPGERVYFEGEEFESK